MTLTEILNELCEFEPDRFEKDDSFEDVPVTIYFLMPTGAVRAYACDGRQSEDEAVARMVLEQAIEARGWDWSVRRYPHRLYGAVLGRGTGKQGECTDINFGSFPLEALFNAYEEAGERWT